MPVSNNITRFLDAKQIPYRSFEIPVEKLSALATAKFLDIDPSLVFKTIVVKLEKGKPILAVIPAGNRVDGKLLADAVGVKKVFVTTEREAEILTGFQAGGISPLALMNKGYQVVIDDYQIRSFGCHEIHISGGQRGLIIRLPIEKLISLTHARTARISLMEEAS